LLTSNIRRLVNFIDYVVDQKLLKESDTFVYQKSPYEHRNASQNEFKQTTDKSGSKERHSRSVNVSQNMTPTNHEIYLRDSQKKDLQILENSRVASRRNSEFKVC